MEYKECQFLYNWPLPIGTDEYDLTDKNFLFEIKGNECQGHEDAFRNCGNKQFEAEPKCF